MRVDMALSTILLTIDGQLAYRCSVSTMCEGSVSGVQKLLKAVCVMTAVWMLSGCAPRWIAQPTTGARAFVTQGGQVYFCDASSGVPRCRLVREVAR